VPLFELDESGSRLVKPMQPAPASFDEDSSQLVTTHLSELLGEGLFPVMRRRRPEDAGPHLLALDVVGQPVVVEVVSELDAETLIRALGYAGQAGRMTSGDLAQLYHAGDEQFRVDLMAFRDSLPAAYSRRGLRVGARLLLVCSSVHPEVVDALEFLRVPGRQVEVMQMGVIHGAGGRRYLDVSPLAGPIAEMRAVEQANLRLVRSDEAFAAAMAYDEQRRANARFAANPEQDPESVRSPFAARGADGPGAVSVVSPPSEPIPELRMPVSPSHASPVSPTARFESTPRATPPTAETAAPSPSEPVFSGPPAQVVVPSPSAAPVTPPAAPVPPATPVPPAPAVPPVPPASAPPAPTAPPRTSVLGNQAAGSNGSPHGPSGAGQVVDGAYVPTFVPASAPLVAPGARPLSEDTGQHPAVPETPAPGQGVPGVPQSQQTAAFSAPSAPLPPSPSIPPTFAVGPPPAPPRHDHLPPPMALSTSPTGVVRHSTRAEAARPAVAPGAREAHPRLLELASEAGPVELVWFRERRNQRLTARLRLDGLIELPSGEVFGDPSAAAQIASKASMQVDGWGVWRLGKDTGPTLGEVLGVS